MWSFKAVITNLSMKFTMFLADGTPTRATANVTLKQAEDPGQRPFQNPTSGGNYGYTTHQVTQGEPIDLIAAREYGDASAWRFIADFNDIDDPFSLQPGSVISLPPSSYD
jgi:nucleoid-associated protein YgaU